MIGHHITKARLCSSLASDPVVFVEGVRTPFLASLTEFQHLMPHQLLACTFQGILERTDLTADQVDYLCAGTVQQEVRTSNIAKEAAFSAGFPLSTPGQVLSNLKALESENFCQENLGLNQKVGTVPMEKLNNWGGSVSIGHPFGATGIRLLSHAAHRLQAEDGERALVAACAGNAQGVAMIMERCV